MQKVTIPGMSVRFPGICPHCDKPSDSKSTMRLSHKVGRRTTSIGVPFAPECFARLKKVTRRRNAVNVISMLVLYFGGAGLVLMTSPDALLPWLLMGFFGVVIGVSIWAALVDWLPADNDHDDYALLKAIALSGSVGGMTFTIFNDRYAAMLNALNPTSTLTPVTEKPGLAADESFRRWWRVGYLSLALALSVGASVVATLFARPLSSVQPAVLVRIAIYVGSYFIPSLLISAVARDLRLRGIARGWLAVVASVGLLVMLTFRTLRSFLPIGYDSPIVQIAGYLDWLLLALMALAAVVEGVLILRADSVTTSMPDYTMPS